MSPGSASNNGSRRRFLITAAALLAAPNIANSQGAKLPRIGVLAMDPLTTIFADAFRAGLREQGYVEGKNIVVEWRFFDATGAGADLAAQELVRRKVDVIVATATPMIQAAKSATSTIPIVMAPAGDPVATGLVASLARPGGNITGITLAPTDLGGKLVGLVREIRPEIARIGVLAGTQAFARPFLEQVQSAATMVGVRVLPVVIKGPADLDEAFAQMARERAGAVIVQPLYATKRCADLAAKYRLPSITTGLTAGAFPDEGGLMSYRPKAVEHYRDAAVYVDKILKGAKPADLPVQQPRTFDLVINLRTAKAIGVPIPQALVLRADRVIE